MWWDDEEYEDDGREPVDEGRVTALDWAALSGALFLLLFFVAIALELARR